MSVEPDQEGRFKSTTIGHADHLFLSPLSLEKADWLIGLLELPSGGVVLDIACGKAGFLRRLLAKRATAKGIGVDINAAFLAEAAAGAAREAILDRLTLVRQAAEEYVAALQPVDAILCFGGSQAVGGFDGLIAVARRMLAPRGQLLIGDGFWQQPPAPAYLALLGATADELTDHAGNATRLRQAGFKVLATAAASTDEWDDYEARYCRAKTRWALAHPEDPDSAGLLEQAQTWHDGYLRWGRATLGFGWYLASMAN
ncbi:MAG TPA: class I SAM-dependent methyltransferase [Burkholderiaceae bacterium]